MQRREALKKATLFIAGIAISPELIAKALADPSPTLARQPADRLALLAEMADTILPDTDTPGAKAAKVHEFIAVVVEDCLSPERRDAFWNGLQFTEQQCIATQGKSFVDCSREQRNAFFRQLQAEAKSAPNDAGEPFWYQLKGITLHGYFTSEIGATQALNYDPIPGGWIPDMIIDDNTKAWTPVF
ncbi:MAG: gluconate 2-dehydrogenase subunit 3 family protein [Lewinellaceae bacterium]|nr:gluconate 2-dehydrogenase subunit 3 family protein [Lewinellaceae bacterium]